MSGYPPGGHYDDGYGQSHGDSYYQDGHGQGYYDPNDYGDSYYDQSYVYPTHFLLCVLRLLTAITVVITLPRVMVTKLGTTMATTTTTATSTTIPTGSKPTVARVGAVTIPKTSPKPSATSP